MANMIDAEMWDDRGQPDDDPESRTVRRMKQERGDAFTSEAREEAIRLYAEVGPTEASRRMGPGGPSKSTITVWAKAAGVESFRCERTAAATEAAQLDWKHRRAGLANLWGDTAAQAIEAAQEAIADRRANDGRQYAITAAVATDKADLLAGISGPTASNIFVVDLEEALAMLERAQETGGHARAGVLELPSTEVGE